MNAIFKVKHSRLGEIEAVYLGTSIDTQGGDYLFCTFYNENSESHTGYFRWKECKFLYYVDDKGKKYDAMLKPIKTSKKK